MNSRLVRVVVCLVLVIAMYRAPEASLTMIKHALEAMVVLHLSIELLKKEPK